MGVFIKVSLMASSELSIFQVKPVMIPHCSVPAGCVALIFLFLAMPPSFPIILNKPATLNKSITLNQSTTMNRSTTMNQTFPVSSIKKIDFLSCFLLFTTIITFLTAFQEAGLRHSWRSLIILAFLVVSGVVWACFLGWEWFINQKGGIMEPQSFYGNVNVLNLSGIKTTPSIQR